MRTIACLILLCFTCFGTLPLHAQEMRWRNPMDGNARAIQGQLPIASLERSYYRLPDDMEQLVRPPVWNLSRQNAGVYIEFTTDASAITVRYQVSEALDMPHMPATGVSGVDLYAKHKNGGWDWAAGSYQFGDTITYRFANLAIGNEEKMRLYLPLYNSVTWMEIGVSADAAFEFVPATVDRPVIVYGTSIAQGACASRPGLAWTSILARQLDLPMVNLGFSGNGRLEKPLIDLIATVDAHLFVLDCMPNLTPGSVPDPEILDRIEYAVTHLKEKHPDTPILLVEHSGGGSSQVIDTARSANYRHTSELMRSAYQKLVSQGVNRLYLLTTEAIGMGTESTVDGVHPNDIGMMQHATAYREIINTILK
ncbi:SGNH/GDSL hydrolase family protein [Parapedobacter lycopersici]|uniref:SGNH/GDSL hydrolase family protein n=1 Tax=Parapedobacter lycopersici TaxID=1864939 RepID=UPI0033418289